MSQIGVQHFSSSWSLIMREAKCCTPICEPKYMYVKIHILEKDPILDRELGYGLKSNVY